MKSSYRQLDTLLRILLLACLSVFLIAWLNPAYWNWAIFSLDSIKPFNFVLLVLIALLLIVPAINRLVYSTFLKIVMGLCRLVSRLPSLFNHAAWIILVIVVLFLLKTNSYILGDGHQILGNAISGDLLSPTAIGFTLLIQKLQKLLNISTISGMAMLISSFSILSGIIFLYFGNKIVGLLTDSKELRILLFLVLISSAVIVLFMGYIETYPIFIAWLAIYIYHSLRFIERHCGPKLLLVIFIFGIVWHLWFIAFLPSLIFNLNNRYKMISNKIILIITFAYVAAIYFLGLYFTRGDMPMMIPFMVTEDSKYFLFAPQHLIDCLNLLFISGPVLTMLGIPLIIASRGSLQSMKLKLLLYASAPALAIAFCIGPEVGAIRDWDLFSAFLIPLILVTLMLFSLKVRAKTNLKFLLLPMLFISLLHTTGFVLNNKDKEASLNRVVGVILEDAHFQADYYGGRRAIPFGTILSNTYNRHDLGAEFTSRALSHTTSGQGSLALANQYYNAGDWEKAVHYYEITPPEEFTNPQYTYTYSISLYYLEKYSEAIDKLKMLLQDTSRAEIYYLLGASYVKSNLPDSAEKYYAIGLEYVEDSSINLQITAQAFYDNEYLDRAAKYCYQALLVQPESESVCLLLGSIYDRLGDYDSSFKYYKTVLQTDSFSYDACLGLANAYYKRDNPGKALDILRRAEHFHSQNPDLSFKIGFMLSVMGRKTEAAEKLRHAIKLEPEYLQARYFLAKIFMEMEMPDSALVQCDSILMINSTYVLAYLGRARAYDKLEESEMAIISLEAWLSLDPRANENSMGRELLKKYGLLY